MKKILLLIGITVCNMVYGQQGFVDNSFGNSGFVAGNLPSKINSILISNDKILSAGGFNASGQLIARFSEDGSLDSSFGKGGFASLNQPVGGATKFIISPDKKILVCGGYVDDNNNLQSFVAKFTNNGVLDSSFGSNGMTVIPLFHKADGYSKLALNADGSIIVGGFGTNSVITLDSQYSIISKLSADGEFDKTFGSNGYILNLASLNMKDLAIQLDGKIVTSGTNFGDDFVFSRYNSNGSLDQSFGNNGNAILTIGESDDAEKIIVQDNGKLMIGGSLYLNKYKMCALRLNTNGSLDNTFGDNGKVLVDFEDSNSRAYDMASQQDGEFILAGVAYNSNNTGSSFALCRITNSGQLDSSFGVNGLQTTAYSDYGQANGVAVQNDGKIVLGGYYQSKREEPSYLMVRYINDLNRKHIFITKIRKWIQHHNGIEWDKASGVSSYVIQRSYDGIHFSSITRISAGNNSNYTFADPSPLSGSNYYRLQTTSIYGAVNYSNVIAVTSDDNTIKISPNPAINSLRIEGLSNQKVQLSVVDFSGNVKLQTTVNNNIYNLNIASLKPGNYLLKIQSQDDVVTKAFVKE